MGGVTSFGHAIVLDEVSSLGLVLPTPPLPRRELKPRSANIHFHNLFQPQLPRKHKNEGVPFFFEHCPVSDLSLFTATVPTHACVTITFTLQHTQKHMHTHANVSYNGDGVTKTGLILALNI